MGIKNNYKDITGKTYGYLTALERLPSERRGKHLRTPWKFLCICGNEKIACSQDVKWGGISSCGCKTKEIMSEKKKKPEGVAASNSLYKSYKEKCGENRGYNFDLSKHQFLKLTKENCYYCNKTPSQIKKSKHSEYIYNGIDRVDNTKGYILENCVACCKDCNSKKAGITKEMVFKLYEWFNK